MFETTNQIDSEDASQNQLISRQFSAEAKEPSLSAKKSTSHSTWIHKKIRDTLW